MKKYLPFLIVGFVAVVTLTSGAVLYRAKRASGVPLTSHTIEVGNAAHVLGSTRPVVTLEEFGDFQCPPCGILSEPLNQMARDLPQLRIVFKHFPLPMHPHANEAARAAEAAGRQGQFWKMHDLLYREQAAWSKAADARALFRQYAGMIGCDVAKFETDIDSEPIAALIEADHEEGAKLGVQNTPSIFLNDTLVPPASLAPTDLRAAVESALRGTAATPAPKPEKLPR